MKLGFHQTWEQDWGFGKLVTLLVQAQRFWADKEVKTGWAKRMRENWEGCNKGPRHLRKLKEQGRGKLWPGREMW